MLLGTFISCFATGPIGSYVGRRWSILGGVVLLIVSIIIMIVTTSLGPLYFSRLLMGFGNGLVMTFTLVYISELAPAKLRGLAFGFACTWVTLGTAVGLVGLPFQTLFRLLSCAFKNGRAYRVFTCVVALRPHDVSITLLPLTVDSSSQTRLITLIVDSVIRFPFTFSSRCQLLLLSHFPSCLNLLAGLS
jgi:MFS family permease